MDLRFSANIGFLWQHLPLSERITAAAQAGFDAAEYHLSGFVGYINMTANITSYTSSPDWCLVSGTLKPQ